MDSKEGEQSGVGVGRKIIEVRELKMTDEPKELTFFEKAYLRGELMIWVPDGDTKTLEQLLTKPLDAIYLTRRQVERESSG